MPILKAHSVPYEEADPEQVDKFRDVPWALALYSDPALRPVTQLTRIPNPSTRDAFVAETLASPGTIDAWQSFYQGPSAQAPLGQVVAVLRLGEGLAGHAHTAHGGFCAVLLDEVTNYAAASHLTPGLAAFTAYMRMDLRRPIPLPSTVYARGWMEPERSSGKKMFMRASIEDGQGGVYVQGESLFVESDPKKILKHRL